MNRGLRKWKIGGAVVLLMLITLYYHWIIIGSSKIPDSFLNKFKPVTYERITWEDPELIYRDSLRVGIGEHGEPGILTDPEDIKKNENLRKEFGSSILISDKISVNRSIPDRRIKACLNQEYLKNLPQVSIVMIFHNDVFSLFKRTLHSLYNRTPHVLIKEVILVNDASTLDYLYKPLEDYIKQNFPKLDIRIINIEKRSGLVHAWHTGFRNATAEYIFCMEAHMELGYNWLPPLLEPVVLDPHTVAVPTVDGIPGDNLRMLHMGPTRFIFDWNLSFGYLSLLPGSDRESPIPHQIPTMTGGKFLFRKDFFFELGGYDEGLLIWGAENWELSLKVNLCGGTLVEVPCSHVGHHYGSFNKYRKLEGIDFEGYNNKRFIEVWLDEFKEFVYKRNPGRYSKLDTGDLTKQKAFRATCKPFRYYLEVVAPDFLARYRFEDFVRGTIKLVNTNYCIDTLSLKTGNTLGLFECDANPENPRDTQYFELTYFRDIRLIHSQICWDNLITTQNCTRIFGNQTFSYDHVTKRIKQDETCLEGNIADKSLRMAPCKKDINYLWQQWEWGFINITAMENFNNLARQII